MKTLCLSLIAAVLASVPFESAQAEAAATNPVTVLKSADNASGGGYKLKRKKRKKSRSLAARRRKRMRGGF